MTDADVSSILSRVDRRLNSLKTRLNRLDTRMGNVEIRFTSLDKTAPGPTSKSLVLKLPDDAHDRVEPHWSRPRFWRIMGEHPFVRPPGRSRCRAGVWGCAGTEGRASPEATGELRAISGGGGTGCRVRTRDVAAPPVDAHP